MKIFGSLCNSFEDIFKEYWNNQFAYTLKNVHGYTNGGSFYLQGKAL